MDVFKDANEQLAKALPFSMIVLFQGLAAGNAIKLPSVLTDKDEILESPIVRFLYITAIAFTATQKIEWAVMSSAAFLVLMHLLRNDEERKGGLF